MSAAHEDWKVLLSLMPSTWKQLGFRTRAVERLRGFDSVETLLRVLLLHVGCGWSLRETGVQAKLAGLASVSDVALLNRLRLAEDWLRQLCQELWKENGVELRPGLPDRRVRVVDATTVKEAGPNGSQWRIHFSLRLPSLECDYFQVTQAKGPDTGEKLGRFRLRRGELVLGDAGYCHPAGVASVVDQGADVCVRLNPGALPLYGPGDERFALLESVESLQQAGEVGEWSVRLRAERRWIPGRICGVRKTEEAIARAQRQITLKQKRGKSQGSEETRRFACYVLVFTTVSPAQALAAEILECYRLRWQIELTFKRFKSIALLGEIPTQNDRSSRAWLYGKLFLALLSQKLTRVGTTISPWGYRLPAISASSESVA
jgi:Transposase DDE domain